MFVGGVLWVDLTRRACSLSFSLYYPSFMHTTHLSVRKHQGREHIDRFLLNLIIGDKVLFAWSYIGDVKQLNKVLRSIVN